MPRPTREELQAQIDALDAEDNVEVWVEDDRGRKTKLTGGHARKWLRNLGLEDEEPDDEEGTETEQQDPKPKAGYFGRKG